VDPWNLTANRIRLAANGLERVAGYGIVLKDGRRQQRIECDDAEDEICVYSYLNWLWSDRGSRSESHGLEWKNGQIEEDLLRWLDSQAWLTVGDEVPAQAVLDTESAAIGTQIDQAVAKLLDEVPQELHGVLGETLVLVLGWTDSDCTVLSACEESSIELAALRLSLGYYSRNAVVVHECLQCASATALLALRHALPPRTAKPQPPEGYGDSDENAIGIGLTQWLAFITRAAVEPRRLLSATIVPPDLPVSTGEQFIIEVERFAEHVIERLGVNPYLQRLTYCKDTHAPLLAGLAIEEYYVTRRFVEIIAPMLSKRLNEPLRQLMFRYFSEELGHEKFEYDTCVAHGVTLAELREAVPLPIHASFVDAFTLTAQLHPMGFLCSIMVTEGLYGRSSPLGDQVHRLTAGVRRLQDVTARHSSLNESLSHDTITRHALSQIAVINRREKRRALFALRLLLELNSCTWEDMATFYGSSPTLQMHGFLGSRLKRNRAPDVTPSV